jgi:hypothetical protein
MLYGFAQHRWGASLPAVVVTVPASRRSNSSVTGTERVVRVDPVFNGLERE